MPIDKALNQAPMGLDSLEVEEEMMTTEPDLEIEIEDPEALRLS